MNEWLRDRMLELVECWNVKKMSSGKCATYFDVTRNVIMGKIIRGRAEYGFEKRGSDYIVKRPKVKPAVAVRKIIVGPNGLQASTRNSGFKEPAPELKNTKSCQIWDLRPHNCVWPISGAGVETWFCGMVKSGQSYCTGHDKMSRRT